MSKPERGTINILGTDWTVVLRRFPDLEDGSMNNLYGYTCPETFEIHINAKKSEASYHDTLLHEVLHAIEYMSGWDIDEDRVRGTSTALRTFFVTNPNVAQWLIS